MTEISEFAFEPIIKKGVRIFRPGEYELLTQAIPKLENKNKFDFMLFTGLRYEEGQRVHDNPNLFSIKDKAIKIASSKPKATVEERWVKLNQYGLMATQYFLRCETNLPCYTAWRDDIKLWCKKANISTVGVSVKSTRKTWESWLIITHPEKIFEICLSQGHTELTSIKHYANLPFSKEEKEHISIYTKGWSD